MRKALVYFSLMLQVMKPAAQPLQFHQLTVNDGLSQNSVYDLCTDPFGFMWIGTADGLNRYDGYGFVQYRKSGDGKKRIRNTAIFSVCSDSQGRIWFAGSESVEMLNPLTGETRELLVQGGKFDASYVYYSAAAGGVMAISRNGIWLINPESGHTEQLAKSTDRICTVVNNISVAESGGLLYIFCTGLRSYFVYNPATRAFREQPLAADLKGTVMSCVSRLSGDQLVFYSSIDAHGMLNVIRPATGEIIRQKEIPDAFIEGFFKGCLYIPDIDRIVVSQSDQGLRFYDTSLNLVNEYPVATLLSSSVQKSYFLNMKWLDHGLWVSTDPNGLSYAALQPARFALFRNLRRTASSVVKGIFTDRQGNVYSGLLNEDVEIFDRNSNYTGTLGPLGAGHQPLQLLAFNSFLNAGPDSIFINCLNFLGYYFPDRRTGQNWREQCSRVIPAPPVNGGTDLYFAAARLDKNRYLISSFDQLVEMQIRNEQAGFHISTRLPANISSLQPAGEKGILTGTENGLYLLKDGRQQFYPQTFKRLIKQITFWQNRYWIATSNGLIELDEQLQYVREYNSDNGLPNNYIYATIPDGNDLWISTNYGLSKMNLQTRQFSGYTVADGLQSNEFNSGAFWKADDGRIYFGGVNGITQINREARQLDFPVPARITAIQWNDSVAQSPAGIWNLKEIRLHYQDKNLVIGYTGLSPVQSRNLSYRYMLEGIDHNWVYAGRERSVHYGALPPGEYTFRVSASVNNRDWNNPETQLRIVISPPYWQTLWFRVLSALFVLLLVTGLVQWYNHRRNKQRLQALKLQQQLEEERKRISRDLHDNMGAYTSALISNVQHLQSRMGADPVLTRMENNAVQILSSLRETIWVLNNKSVSVEDFSGGFKNYCFNILKNYSDLDFTAQEAISRNSMLPAGRAVHLNKILQEAFQNSIKHAKATLITFRIEAGDQLRIILRDNGCGFDPETVTRGQGLANLRWRAEQAGMFLQIESKAGAGTIVTLTGKNIL